MSNFSSHLSKFFVTPPNDPTTMGITCTVIIIIIIIVIKLQGLSRVFFLTNVLQTLCRFQGFCYRRASGSVRFARRSAVGWILLLEKVGSARHSRNAIKQFKGNLK